MPKIQRSKPHPRWGATKAQGNRNARERELKNRIHDLETALAAQSDIIARQAGQIEATNAPPRDAIQVLLRITVAESRRLGATHALEILADWYDAMEAASGKR